MQDRTNQITLGDKVIGPLYAFLYYTANKRVVGLGADGLLKNLPWLLGVLAWPFGLGLGWTLLGFFLAIVMRILYWQGSRAGYIRFVPDDSVPTSVGKEKLASNQKVKVLASGIFSVQTWERYVRQHPAHYWFVGMGDHAVMVDYSAGRYLYQFIKPGRMESVVPGVLCSGRKPQLALEISFHTDWGPESPLVDFLFYSPGKEDKPKLLMRKMYLAFDDPETRTLVWNALNHTDNKENE